MQKAHHGMHMAAPGGRGGHKNARRKWSWLG